MPKHPSTIVPGSATRPRGRPRKINLTAKQQHALRIDAASRLPELPATPASAGTLPRGIGSTALARKVGASRRAVDHWRNRDPVYRSELLKLLAAPLLERLARRHREQSSRLPAGSTPEGLAKQRSAFIRAEWNGPVLSMLTGKDFDTPEAYAAHIAEHDVLLTGQLHSRPHQSVKPFPGIEYLRADCEPPAEETAAERGKKREKRRSATGFLEHSVALAEQRVAFSSSSVPAMSDTYRK